MGKMTSRKSNTYTLRSLLLATVITLFLTTVLGGVLRTVGGLGACPDWPLCFGTWMPPLGKATAMVDYFHRMGAALTGLFGILALIQSLRGDDRRTRVILAILSANLISGLQIPLGGWMHLNNHMGVATAAHLGLALMAQALFLFALSAVYKRRIPPFIDLFSPYKRLSLLVMLLTLFTLVSGAMVTVSGATSTCPGWPLCQGWDFSLTPLQWLGTAHRLMVLLTSVSYLLLLTHSWQTQKRKPALLTAATAAGILYLSQGFMGAVNVANGYPSALLALHQGTAVAVWSTITIHTTLAGGEQGNPTASLEKKRHGKQVVSDLLALTKPIVVALLLVTTFAGMVIGAKAWPSLNTTFWVLLGGFMAAGGSGAINQFIDRQDDQHMQRTQDRPIPSGRITPGEGLAFGVGLSIASFYIMAAFVNMIAALLTLAGTIYYVLIYSIYLKKTTVQNIVIGGGAGAIPPLVGWAAATGGLNIPSLFLFAVVFMWTPPHFWALAIVRRKDYARANIPMLPVAQGVEKTRRQIFVYTVELVALTLLLPLFGLGGSIYFIFAVALGGWLLSAAWKVLKREGNRFAWRMYRYSSMYLAFLFAALMVDALL